MLDAHRLAPIYKDDMLTVLNYQERLARRLEPEVDSEVVSGATACLLILDHDRNGNVKFENIEVA